MVGGYHSVDNGCPAWGTADNRNARIIGDTMGYVTVTYTDGTVQEIPLVFGYTMWYHNNWQEVSAPFKSGRYHKELVSLLKSTLSLKGAFEGNDTCVFRVKRSDKPVRSVELRDNQDKEGTPVLKGGFLTTGFDGELTLQSFTFHASDSFFDTHTVDGEDPFPQSVRGGEKANSYYTAYYSRDGGRALMTLNQYGYTAAAERSVQYANRQMMYLFPAEWADHRRREHPRTLHGGGP